MSVASRFVRIAGDLTHDKITKSVSKNAVFIVIYAPIQEFILRSFVLNKLVQNQGKFTVLFLMFMVLGIICVYYPSLSVPFYLDDRGSIVSNLAIHAGSLDMLLQSGLERRFIGYFTLWVNYQLGGLEPAGYHLVNIGIHIINSLLVFVMVLQLIRYFSPTEQKHIRSQQLLLAMAVTAVWALHPLNSQAITYVTQRLASIVTLFYLLSIISYIKLRQHILLSESKASSNAQSKFKAMAYAVLLFTAIIGGLHAKQNFVAVLVFLYCWEWLTCSTRTRRILLKITLGLGIAMMLAAPFMHDVLLTLDNYTRDAFAPSRGDYFYTQQLVLWDYIWRFIYPFALQLNIDTLLQTSLTPLVGLALLAHVAVLSTVYTLRKSIPLLCVGVVFFYTSHVVESFIIPIKDLAFEHRTYVGNIGLMLAIGGLLQYFWQRNETNKTAHSLMVCTVAVVLLVVSFATAKRNKLWQTPLAFHANEVSLAPEQARANASYGTELMKLGRYDDAQPYLKKSVDINLAKNKMTASGLTAYITVLYHANQYQKAAAVAMLGLKYIHNPLERSDLLGKLGFGYMQMGIYDFAKGLLTNALNLDPNNTEARTNLALCLATLKQQGR